ncbi:hypothetical protein B566_EDAN016796 [Ephemera danica]|nr:hypothetical protein B566_EDAN016796 [Ephemera danica]
MWRETPIPMYIDIYLFNWTNPEDVNNTNIKPFFDELGPYVFRESHERVNISWKEGFLVEFNQIRTYHFMPELSNGSLTDKVTNLNVIAATAAYTIRNHPVLLWGLNEVFKGFNTPVSVTKTAGQWMFDGFRDPLLTVINIINTLNDTILPIDVPFDKFGWFYGRNLSWSYDGLFEMHTGEDDISNLGILTRWNNMTKTNYYDSYCGMVNGTTGELWPPVYSTGNITLFASDICRSMMLEYNGTSNVEGVEGYVYVGNRHLLDNGDLYPENKCFCSNKPREEPCALPTGVANVSLCRYGAPAFVSYPHFYLSDPFYTEKIDMPKATDKDVFFLTLEPRTGIPLNVEAKLQINVLMKSYRQIGIFRKVTDAFMPAIWFNQRAQLTPELASKLQLLLYLPIIGISVFSVLLIIGVILFGVGVYKKMWGQWSVTKQAEYSVNSELDKNDASTN